MQPHVWSIAVSVTALVLATGLVGLRVTPSEAQDINILLDPKVPCAGELEKRYPDYPWDFTTNSRMPAQTPPPFTFMHCGHNNKGSAVDIRWLIPELKQPVGPNESAFSPRYSAKPPLEIADGCLIYGNLHDKSIRAQFWARQEDKIALDEEKKNKDCIGTASSKAFEKVELITPRNMAAPFRIFLPAIQASPETSLVAFEGITGIRSASPDGYESFVTYRLRPAQDSKGYSLDGYRIVPRWSAEVERLLGFYKEAGNAASLPLRTTKDVTEIHFFVKGSDNWTFHELEYQLLLKEQSDVLTSLHVPVFVPVQ
jgi:hypothetical protein